MPLGSVMPWHLWMVSAQRKLQGQPGTKECTFSGRVLLDAWDRNPSRRQTREQRQTSVTREMHHHKVWKRALVQGTRESCPICRWEAGAGKINSIDTLRSGRDENDGNDSAPRSIHEPQGDCVFLPDSVRCQNDLRAHFQMRCRPQVSKFCRVKGASPITVMPRSAAHHDPMDAGSAWHLWDAGSAWHLRAGRRLRAQWYPGKSLAIDASCLCIVGE